MADWLEFERDGTRLSCLDYGGPGQPVVLLHGLAGHAGEWSETAAWLRERTRVLAPDARGHGRSERFPVDVSPEVCVADVAFLVERVGLGPVVLVGQSLGGHTALLVAAEAPELVRGLVVAEAGPAGDSEAAIRQVATELSGWPVPFASRAEAIRFFGGATLAAAAWVGGLEERGGGLRPRFDVDVMTRMLRAAMAHPRWEQWRSIQCPTLVVRAGRGTLTTAEANKMLNRLPHASLAEIPDAEHDLHLDRPAEWRAAISSFIERLGS